MANDEAFFNQYAGNSISVAFQIYLIRLEQEQSDGCERGYESDVSNGSDQLAAVSCQWSCRRCSMNIQLLFLFVQIFTRKCHTNRVNSNPVNIPIVQINDIHWLRNLCVLFWRVEESKFPNPGNWNLNFADFLLISYLRSKLLRLNFSLDSGKSSTMGARGNTERKIRFASRHLPRKFPQSISWKISKSGARR